MQEVLKHLIGILVLGIAFIIGNYLACITKEELKQGKKWFKLIILISIIGSLISLILKNDIYLYTFLFILFVTSRSLRK